MEQAWGSRCSSDFCFFAMAEPYGSRSVMPAETPPDKPDLHGSEYKLKIVEVNAGMIIGQKGLGDSVV